MFHRVRSFTPLVVGQPGQLAWCFL